MSELLDQAKRPVPGLMECLEALISTENMAPKMAENIRAILSMGRPQDVATICHQLRADMWTAGLWTPQDLLDFSVITDKLRKFLEQQLAAGRTTFTIARYLISQLGPIGEGLMREVRNAVKEEVNDSRLEGRDLFHEMKPAKDGEPRFHSTVIADASRGVEGQPDVSVECSLVDILKVNGLVHGRVLCDVIAADAYTCLIPGHRTWAALNRGNR